MSSDKLLNFRCPSDLLKAIDERAKVLNQTRTDVVLSVLRSAFHLHGEERDKNYIASSWLAPNPMLAALEERISVIEKKLEINPAALPGEYGKPQYSLGVEGHLSLLEAYIYAVWRFKYKGSMASFSLLSPDKIQDYGIEYYLNNLQPGTEFRPYRYAASWFD